MAEFKKGDRVKIRRDSIYYGVSASNPKDIEGTINIVGPNADKSHSINVLWDNHIGNSYRIFDLEHVNSSGIVESYEIF